MLATPTMASKVQSPVSCTGPSPAKPTPPTPGSADEMRAVARKFADQPLQNPEPGVWAVLTAISQNARHRPEGMNILLSADEHILGRTVENPRFRISALAVSGKHCRIYRDTALEELRRDEPVPVYFKDTSTNGTYVNWKKFTKKSPPVKLNHGDIISFSSAPHIEASYAFVYREVNAVSCVGNGTTALKRKSGEIGSENKRLKGLGIGSSDGPVSLDDVRRLEKSNAELREQLEAHVVTIETLRTERKIAEAEHEKELKEIKETTSSSYLDQTKSLQLALEEKQKQLDSFSTSNTELQNSVKDLNERLSASKQSRSDADEIINSQKTNICELEEQLSDERNMRIEERDKAAEDLKSAVHKVQAEAEDKMKKQTEVYLKQQREQKEFITKLQEAEKETRLLVETLRSKLEDSRESLVISEKKVRELETQLQDEQLVSANNQKKSDNLETELRKLKKELEHEKAAREEAWAKVSSLELEVAATMRDLELEKRRYQGARERVILRETQLRAFYSTTEEISSLFAKQQEQLKAMQRTLEDEENYESTLMGLDLNEVPLANVTSDDARVKPVDYVKDSVEASGENTQASGHSSSDEDADMTEQQDGGTRVEGGTQDLECTTPERSVEKLGYDSHGDRAATATEQVPTDTEQFPETESQAGIAGCNDQNSINSVMAGDTMQLEDDVQVQENEESNLIPKDGGQPLVNEEQQSLTLKDGIGQCSEEKREGDCSESKREDTQTGTIRTADLLASELAGSWAVDTGPSVNGENESPCSSGGDPRGEQDDDVGERAAADALTSLVNSDGHSAGSQTNVADRRVINHMIGLLNPEKKLPGSGAGDDDSTSDDDDETQEGSETGDDSEAMVEDSVG
ncbi:uncharacterized protein [Lolium perenne]|uniref:uncharacterized protein isoform X2 n=1 Tax=Lolium perenne TaxID=4522 RepID=UPI0021F564C9|nr:uncharacterized protein LOC127297252 isoform X2 [Lolium perenne]